MTDEQPISPAENIVASGACMCLGMTPYPLEERAKHPPYMAAIRAMRAEREAVVAYIRERADNCYEDCAWVIWDLADDIEAREHHPLPPAP